MNSPTQKTIKRLFAVSRNQCAFPGCEIPLVEDSGTVTGEIAHIKSVSANGSRFDRKQTDEERHSFDNLILLCGRHHRVIDVEVEKYSVKYLLKIKHEHESQEMVSINSKVEPIANALLQQYENLIIAESGSKVAVHSPGAIQTDVVEIKTIRKTVNVAAPQGTIASSLWHMNYTKHLIDRYHEFKRIEVGEGAMKYPVFYQQIKRQFGTNWKMVALGRFEGLVAYIQSRIDKTKHGRVQKSRGIKNYSSFEEYLEKHGYSEC